MAVEHVKILNEEAGQRVDRWLRKRYPHLTQGRIEKLLRKGEVRVDGGRIKASQRLESGQEVRIPPLSDRGVEYTESPKTAALSHEDLKFIRSLIVYQDDYVIVLNKPPGLSVQGGTGQTRHVDGLLSGLMFDRPDKPRLVHRIDKDTSGLLVLARTPRAAADLGAAFRSKAVRKRYWGVVNGVPKPRVGTISFALQKAPGHGPYGAGEKMIPISPRELDQNPEAKRALTDYAVLESAGARAAWVALRPVTGRTHQLRAHMAAIGCPLAGDGKYGTNAIGNDGDGWGAQMGGQISRKLHLHARALDLPHPDGGVLSLLAPLPTHMRETWSVFGWDPEGEGDLLPEGWAE